MARIYFKMPDMEQGQNLIYWLGEYNKCAKASLKADMPNLEVVLQECLKRWLEVNSQKGRECIELLKAALLTFGTNY